MSDDRPGHMERLSQAIVSRNLRVMGNARTDVDYLAAAGAASRRLGIGASTHLRDTTSAADLRRAREEVLGICQGLNRARRWGLPVHVLEEITEAAMVHHLELACRHCRGLGFRLVPGAPVKSDKVCSHCKGVGRHPISRKHRTQVEAVLIVLRDRDARVERQIAALMR